MEDAEEGAVEDAFAGGGGVFEAVFDFVSAGFGEDFPVGGLGGEGFLFPGEDVGVAEGGVRVGFAAGAVEEKEVFHRGADLDFFLATGASGAVSGQFGGVEKVPAWRKEGRDRRLSILVLWGRVGHATKSRRVFRWNWSNENGP